MNGAVLIVDDEAAFREHARRLLGMRGLRVVGEAGDGAEAVRVARELQPGGVLLDVNLPDFSGLEVARQLRLLPSSPRVVLTSADAYVSDDDVLRCGATAFLPKDFLPRSDLLALLGSGNGDP